MHRNEFGSPLQSNRRHREGRLRQVLRAYRFEVFWLVVVALGVLLIFERLDIRSSMFEWFGRVSAVAMAGVGRLGDQLDVLLARVTLSDAIGLALVLAALVVVALRVRWRLIHNPAVTLIRCPQCHGQIHRVHRRAGDRLISLYVPVRRYRCANDQCLWHGLRVSDNHGSGRSPSRVDE